MFDKLQIRGKCCGVTDWSDFSQTPWAELEENIYFMVPNTCCKQTNKHNGVDCRSGNNMELIHSKGCYSVVAENIQYSVDDIKVV